MKRFFAVRLRQVCVPALAVALFIPSVLAQDRPEEGRENVLRRYQQAVRLGQSRRNEGNFESAHSWLNVALEAAEALDDPEKELFCLIRLGRLGWSLGLPEEAQAHYQAALAAAVKIGVAGDIEAIQTTLKIYDLYSQGKADLFAGRNDKATQALSEAVELARRNGNPEQEVKCLRQLSLNCWAKQDFNSYLSINNRALKLARELNDRREQARALQNFGLFHFNFKNYNQALDYYSEALDMARDTGQRDIESSCLKNIGITLLDLGFYEKSSVYLRTADEIDRQSGNAGFFPQNLNNLGEAVRNKGMVFSSRSDLSDALGYFAEALSVASKTGNRAIRLISLNNMGNIHLDLGYYHSALHYLQAALRLAQEIDDQEAAVRILANMGTCRLRLGDYILAKAYFNQAVKPSGRGDSAPDIWEPLFHLGECSEKLGASDQALAYYRNSIAAIDALRSRIRSDEYKAGFARSKIKVYEALASLLFRLGSDAGPSGSAKEIFHVVEKAKARAFLETLAGVESEYPRTEKEVSKAAGLNSPQPIRLEEVQEELLSDQTVIVEYYLGETQSFLFLITKTELRLWALPPSKEIEKSIFAYLRLLSDSPQGPWRGIRAGKRLAEELLSPALEALPDPIDHLIIIPDGNLCVLPFETLPLSSTSRSQEKNYLISAYAVSYAASCSSLLFLKDRRPEPRPGMGFLGFGNPLYDRPGSAMKKGKISAASMMQEIYEGLGFDLIPLEESQREIQKIARLFPQEKRDVYLKKKASEERIKTVPLADYQVIHLACHGFQDDRVPFRSGLFLASPQTQTEDGFLRADEIAALPLRSELVVLSACRTGTGFMERGEGTMGLTRIFLSAGARSVVSSLWQVSDKATAEFMRFFYEGLIRGASKAGALRLAKLRMLESKYAHPFYWAAFVLHGDPFSGLAFD